MSESALPNMLMDDDDDSPFQMPEGRTSPAVTSDEVVFSLVVADDGWVNAVLDTDDRTMVQVIARKLREIAAQMETVGATQH